MGEFNSAWGASTDLHFHEIIHSQVAKDMRSLTLTSLFLAVGLVHSHGFLKNIQVNGKTYPAWQVGQDDFVKPPPVRYARKLKDNGSVPDFTSKDITYVLFVVEHECFAKEADAVLGVIFPLKGLSSSKLVIKCRTGPELSRDSKTNSNG